MNARSSSAQLSLTRSAGSASSSSLRITWVRLSHWRWSSGACTTSLKPFIVGQQRTRCATWQSRPKRSIWSNDRAKQAIAQ